MINDNNIVCVVAMFAAVTRFVKLQKNKKNVVALCSVMHSVAAKTALLLLHKSAGFFVCLFVATAFRVLIENK